MANLHKSAATDVYRAGLAVASQKYNIIFNKCFES